MVKVGLYVRLEAKAGKEDEVEQFLKSGLSIVQSPILRCGLHFGWVQQHLAYLMHFPMRTEDRNI